MVRKVKVGSIVIGDGNITIQSMTNTKTNNIECTVKQINALADVGCDMVRVAVTDMDEVRASKSIIALAKVPLIADIQFDYRLAIACCDVGYSKIRFNPGNIGSEANVRDLVCACKANGVPIRIGVNSGSIEKNILTRYGRCAEALVASALENVSLLEKYGFEDIVISAKSSNVREMIETYRILSSRCDYPLHLGVTESGYGDIGLVKSAIGIGSLLADGIGDTIRVSLTGDPLNEVRAAREILRACGIDKNFCEIISCPTCSRTEYDMSYVVKEIGEFVKDIRVPLKIAIMGCVVNGPGEAADCDLGVAGGRGKAVIFSRGKILTTIPTNDIVAQLKMMIKERVNVL